MSEGRDMQKTEFLSEASRVLGSSLDYEMTLGNLARLVVPILADWCVIDIAEEGGELDQSERAEAEHTADDEDIVRAPGLFEAVVRRGEHAQRVISPDEREIE